MRPSLGNRIQAAPRVMRAVRTDTGDRLVGRDLCQQLRQHGRVPNGVAGDFDGPYLQRLRIDPEVNLAQCAAVLGAVLLAFAFAFTQELAAQAKLDCSIREKLPAPALTARCGLPLHPSVSHTVRERRALSAALYCAQFVVRYLLRIFLSSFIRAAYPLRRVNSCNKAN